LCGPKPPRENRLAAAKSPPGKIFLFRLKIPRSNIAELAKPHPKGT
jgi:hypothetical protein